MSELRLLAECEKYDIICVTETMFSSDILDAEVHIRNYNVFRSDRVGGQGGGSCIYVRNTISAEFDVFVSN